MLDLNALSVFQITSFTLAIVFSILALAEIFFTLRNPNMLKNHPVLKFCVVLLCPFVAITLWVLTILSATTFFANEELYAILVALACGIVATAIIALIAKAIINKKYPKKEETNVEVVEFKEPRSEEEILAELSSVEKSLQELKEVIDDVIEEEKVAEATSEDKQENIAQPESEEKANEESENN